MQIEQVDINTIKMYEKNAKKHPAKQVEQKKNDPLYQGGSAISIFYL